MITEIVFFTGGCAAAEPVDYFQEVHRQFFEDSGVVTTYIPDAYPPWGSQPGDLAALLDDATFAPLARQQMEALRQANPARPEVLLVKNVYLHKNPLALALYCALCRRYFPEVPQRAVFIASPADREVEASCIHLLVYGYPLIPALNLRWAANAQPLLEQSFALLDEQFGQDAVTIIPFENEEQACRAFAAAVFRNLPAAVNGLAALAFRPSAVAGVVQREVLTFMSGVNQLFAAPSSAQCSPHYWRNFERFLCGVKPAQCLSAEIYGELQKKFDLPDCKALVKRKLSPWQRREDLPGLTDDDAFRLACLLPPAQVEVLLQGPHLPEQYRTYGARQCLRALQRAAGKSGAGAGGARSGMSHQPPKLSVLTLCYNQAPYIGECIESVIAQQTDFPIQHLIGDKASDDGTQEIIMDYAARYPHIVPVFQSSSHDPASERNTHVLFEMARSEYVALCDGDDYFTDPAKLQTQVDLLDAHPNYALCFHPVRVVYEDAPERERLFPPIETLPGGVRPFYQLLDLLRNNFIQSNSAVYRWRFRHGLPDWFRTDMRIADKYWHILHAEMGKIGFINKAMSVYRRHKSSLSYLSDFDPQKYRAKIAMQEVRDLDIINRHFNRKYEPIFLDLINHVFADCVFYDHRQQEAGVAWEPILDKLTDAYPDFARHFLTSLNLHSE